MAEKKGLAVMRSIKRATRITSKLLELKSMLSPLMPHPCCHTKRSAHEIQMFCMHRQRSSAQFCRMPPNVNHEQVQFFFADFAGTGRNADVSVQVSCLAGWN